MRLARTVTLFSGGGLLEAGICDLIEPVLAVEFDPEIAAHYRYVWGDHVLVTDIRGVNFERLATQLGPVDYLHASPVCKDFNWVKQTCGITEEAAELDIETAAATARALAAFQPEVFTLENVPRYETSTALEIITDALDELAYKWDANVFDAAAYGAPTTRERLLIRAVRHAPLPAPPAPVDFLPPWYVALEDLIPTLPDSYVPDFMEKRLRNHGINWRRIEMPLLVAGGSGNKQTVPHAWADEPAFTIKATPGEKHRLILPDKVVLSLTPRALARLTGLPDDYPLPDNRIVATTIVGNGVPPPLSRAVIGPLLAAHQRYFHGPNVDY